jgi:hypothetical protein
VRIHQTTDVELLLLTTYTGHARNPKLHPWGFFIKYLMKYLIILLALVTIRAHSEPQQMGLAVFCDTPAAIFTPLARDFLEQPVWTGSSNSQNTRLILTANPKTGTWTMVELGTDFACVIAAGREHKFVLEPNL